MKFCILIAVLAFVAPNDGWSLDYDRLVYAAGRTVHCDLCELIVSDVHSILAGNEHEIKNLFDSLCDDLPKEYQTNCTTFVNNSLPILFEFIDDMFPAMVCKFRTTCTYSDVTLPESGPSQWMTFLAQYFVKRISDLITIQKQRINYFRHLVGENYLCEACEDGIGLIHEAVAWNYTWQEMVANFFERACQLCPYPDGCMDFFRSLPGDVNDFANKYLDPVQDCKIFGFCPAEEEEEEEIEGEVEGTDVQIEEARIPVQPQTRTNVDVNDRVCRNAGKGSQEDVSQVPYIVSGDQQEETEPVSDQSKCEICCSLSSDAEGVLQYNEANITKGLSLVFDDICNALPDQWKSECQTGIKDVLPDMMYKALLKLMSPDCFCVQIIGVCGQ